MILVVDSDEIFGRGLVRIIEKKGFEGKLAENALQAIAKIDSGEMPEMVFLEIFLTGPDGFTLLNELASYPDTMKIPIVIVSDRDFKKFDLSDYNVAKILNKETMRPEDVFLVLEKYLGAKNG